MDFNIDIYQEQNEIWDITKRILSSIFFAIVITFAVSIVTGFQFYLVRTGSMTPTLPVWTMVMIDNTEYEDLEMYDIITYRSNDPTSTITYTHRVVDFDEDGCVITKGDADDRRERVVKERYEGKVVFHSYLIGRTIAFIKENVLAVALVFGMLLFWYAFS